MYLMEFLLFNKILKSLIFQVKTLSAATLKITSKGADKKAEYVISIEKTLPTRAKYFAHAARVVFGNSWLSITNAVSYKIIPSEIRCKRKL